jgi:DNA invertase Pin-like site-specific DNA recombinase
MIILPSQLNAWKDVMKKLIGYTRVSTKEQGKTKNGLEAQAEAIRLFAHYHGYELIEIVQEVRTGADDERPVLAEITKRAKKIGAYVVVNKLDRLSRDAVFILTYVRDNPRTIVTQLGEDVDPFTLHIYAGLAEKERMMIAERTKAGLQAKKARGESLGAKVDVLGRAQAAGGVAAASKADEFAKKVQPTLQRMVLAGMSYRAMAAELNAMQVKTVRGGEWHPMTVKNVVERFKEVA